MKSKSFILLMYLIMGTTIGTFFSSYISQFKYMEWLGIGDTFGIATPTYLDLAIFQVTFGFTFEVYIGSVIGFIFAGILYRLFTY